MRLYFVDSLISNWDKLSDQKLSSTYLLQRENASWFHTHQFEGIHFYELFFLVEKQKEILLSVHLFGVKLILASELGVNDLAFEIISIS